MKLGMRLTESTAVWAALLVVMSAAAVHVPAVGIILAGLLLLAAALSVVSYSGGTAFQWIHRRWSLRAKLKPAWLVDAQGHGLVWDGKSAAMFVEIQGSPWELSLVRSDGASTTRSLPLDALRSELRQYDITIDRIRVIDYGFKVNTDDRASASLLSVVGGLPHRLGGRVFIEVAVNLGDNLNAIRARGGEENPEIGLVKTIRIATERVLRVFQVHNISAHILSPSEVSAFQRDIMGSLGPATQHPRWEFLGIPGDAEVGTAVSFIPSQWNRVSQNQWNEVLAHRQYDCLTLRPDGVDDRVSFSTTFLVDDPESLNLLTSQGLRRENGRHLPRVSSLLPLSQDLNADDDGRSVPRDTDPGLFFPAHPLGVFLGLTPERERVFMNAVRGGEPLWIIGDDEYARRFVLRMSTQRHRVAVTVPERTWYDLTVNRQSPLLTFAQDPRDVLDSIDILVCTPEQAALVEPLIGINGPAVVVISPHDPPIQPRSSIAWSESGDRVFVHSYGVTLPVLRERPPTERQWIPDLEYAT